MHGCAQPLSHADLCAYLQSLENVPGTDKEYVVALAKGQRASVRANPQRTTTQVPHSFAQLAAGAPTPQRQTFVDNAAPGAAMRDYAAQGMGEPGLSSLASQLVTILESALPPHAAQRIAMEVGLAVGTHLERAKSSLRQAQQGAVALSAAGEQRKHEPPSAPAVGASSQRSQSEEPASQKPKKAVPEHQAPNGVPFVGEPSKAWYEHGDNLQAYRTANPGLAFLLNAKLATGISVTHPEGTSGPRPGQRVVVDGGANLMVATYREAAEGGWPVVEDPGSFFPLGPMSQVQHRVAGGVDVTYAAGTPFERTVKGVTCFLVPSISNTGAGVLLASTATQPVGAMVDPVLHSLRFRPFYGVEGSTDATCCNLPVRYECEQQRPTVCMAMQA